MIGPINLGEKLSGKRSAGNPHAAFDVAGAGNVSQGSRIEDRSENCGEYTEPYRKARQFSTLQQLTDLRSNPPLTPVRGKIKIRVKLPIYNNDESIFK